MNLITGEVAIESDADSERSCFHELLGRKKITSAMFY